MSKLWIFSDSYADYPSSDDIQDYWMHILADKLNVSELCILSKPGSCQDWVCEQISQKKLEIEPQDYIVVILTDPARFYFSEHTPHLTNINLKTLRQDLPTGVGNAAMSYFAYLQRDSLDLLKQHHRLGWLNNLVNIYKWQTPVVLFGFQSTDTSDYSSINFATGNMQSDVSLQEFSKVLRESGDSFSNLEVFDMVDPRACHMCFDNHKVLADKIYTALTTGSNVDLTHGFNTGMLYKGIMQNNEFANKQFSKYHFNSYKEHTTKKGLT